MNEQEFNEAKQLWLMFYASECFRRARASAQHILEHKMGRNDPLFYPLLTATYVMYGKPFTEWRGVGRLPETMVPSEHIEQHRLLMQHRNTLYAHTDANPFPVADYGPPSQVRVLRTDNSMRLHSIDFHARFPAMSPIITLCDLLEKKANYHVKKQWDKHKAKVPRTNGEFALNILDKKAEMWLLAKPMILDGKAN